MGAGCSQSPSDNVAISRKEVEQEVRLNIYDIGESEQVQTMNRFLQPLGTGAFHCGVEVLGWEWSYCEVYDTSSRGLRTNQMTGIFVCRPEQCDGHNYVSSLDMGFTWISKRSFAMLMQQLMEEWKASDYNTLLHNCCHFCDELCMRLGVGPIPQWVKSMAGAGEKLGVRVGEVVDCRCCTSLSNEVMTSCGRDLAVVDQLRDGVGQDIDEEAMKKQLYHHRRVVEDGEPTEFSL